LEILIKAIRRASTRPVPCLQGSIQKKTAGNFLPQSSHAHRNATKGDERQPRNQVKRNSRVPENGQGRMPPAFLTAQHTAQPSISGNISFDSCPVEVFECTTRIFLGRNSARVKEAADLTTEINRFYRRRVVRKK
jgi:hypothetical protein